MSENAITERIPTSDSADLYSYDSQELDCDEECANEFEYLSHDDIINVLRSYTSTEHAYYIYTENVLPIHGFRKLFYSMKTSANYFIIQEYVEDERGKYYVFHLYIFCNEIHSIKNRVARVHSCATYEKWDKNIIETINMWNNSGLHDWDVIEARQRKKLGQTTSLKYVEY